MEAEQFEQTTDDGLDLATRLERYRRIAGRWTMTDLAEQSGVDLTIISRLESGRRKSASYDVIMRLANAFNLKPLELVPLDPPLKPRHFVSRLRTDLSDSTSLAEPSDPPPPDAETV